MQADSYIISGLGHFYNTQKSKCWHKPILYSTTGMLVQALMADSHIILSYQGVGTSISDPITYYTQQLGSWYKWCKLVPILYSATGVLVQAAQIKVSILNSATGVLAKVACADSHIILNYLGVGTCVIFSILSNRGVGASGFGRFSYKTQQPGCCTWSLGRLLYKRTWC